MTAVPQHEAAPEPVEGIKASIFDICQGISSTLDLQTLLDMILEHATREVGAEQGSILLIDRDSEDLRMLATRGMPRDVVERGYIPRKGSIAEWVIENAKPLLLNEDSVNSEGEFRSIATERRIHASMCIPLQAQGKVIGTLNITRTHMEHFTEADLSTMVIMASQAAVAIENARLHEELLQTTRLATLGQTVSGISHCIKNILTGVKGGMAIMEIAQKEADQEMGEKGWEMLKRNINRISLLVLDMLDFSKQRVPMRGPVDLASLVADVIGVVAYRAEESEVGVKCDLPPELPRLNVDSDQFFRCLLNVVGNAIEASEHHGTVSIRAIHVTPHETAYRMFSTDGERDYTIIEVVDHGHGIPPHMIDKIFDPFYSTKGSKGTGLGMPVTKKIIEEHGGLLEVDSQPGRGTTVRFIMPHVEGGSLIAERMDG